MNVNNNSTNNAWELLETTPGKVNPADFARIPVEIAIDGAKWILKTGSELSVYTEEQMVKMGFGEEMKKLKEMAATAEPFFTPLADRQGVHKAAVYATIPFTLVALAEGIAAGTGAAHAVLGAGAAGALAAGVAAPVVGVLAAGAAAVVVYNTAGLAGNATYNTAVLIYNVSNSAYGKMNDTYQYYFGTAAKAETLQKS